MELKTLGNIVSRKIGYGVVQPGSPVLGGVPIVKVKDIISGLKSPKDLDTADPSIESRYLRSRLRGGELLVSVVGTTGKTAIVPYSFEGCNVARAVAVVDIPDALETLWIKYYIDSPQGQEYITRELNTTVQPTLNIKSLVNMPIPFPKSEQMEKTVSILNLIDSKIALNNKINQNLLQQMEALYKAWFVDYIPFGQKRPISWEKTDIYSLANIIYGAPFSSKLFNSVGEGLPVIRIRDLKEQRFVTYTTEQHPKGHLIQPGDIVVGMDGEFRPYIWGNTEAWLNQRVCIFANNRPKGKAFLLFAIKPLLYQIEQTQVATTVIHIGKKDFDGFKLNLPDDETLDRFDDITAPMFNQIVLNRLEEKRLSDLRDFLLPRLMSGELESLD